MTFPKWQIELQEAKIMDVILFIDNYFHSTTLAPLEHMLLNNLWPLSQLTWHFSLSFHFWDCNLVAMFLCPPFRPPNLPSHTSLLPSSSWPIVSLMVIACRYVFEYTNVFLNIICWVPVMWLVCMFSKLTIQHSKLQCSSVGEDQLSRNKPCKVACTSQALWAFPYPVQYVFWYPPFS